MHTVRDFFVFELICDGREIATPLSVSSADKTSPPIHRCTAIWDTGATSSMISADLANALQLESQGTVRVSGVHGVEDANIYTINLQFNNGFALDNLQVSESGNNAGFDVLIGMDVISRGIFVIDGVNHHQEGCQIAFACPAETNDNGNA